MPEHLQTVDGNNVVVARHPDSCPICHNKITAAPRLAWLNGASFDGTLRVLYSCPNTMCREIFIGYFKDTQNVGFSLISTRPSKPTPIAFNDNIKSISESFCTIYTEAHTAEQIGLSQICGVGYRKSLEFLMKDYLIKQRPIEKGKIEALPLGTCIENYVDDPRIKEVSKRATWLGNDETHYQRRWIDKDLSDLKAMIRLAIHWIEMEHLTAEALASMPPKGGIK